jgi:predicted MFS family arabinose efflux permease
MQQDILPKHRAIWVFVAMASAYFLSTLLRAVTATLSPTLTQELALEAKDLGLLAGGYFLGFSFTQLPMGRWLDQYGPKKVVLSFLCLAVVGCIAFALAPGFSGLLLARVLIGVGVSACLMAPLTGYRRWLPLEQQQRANAWMLMTGAFGMLASTLPVQWLLPVVGWRWIFAGVALLIVLSMALMAWQVPTWRQASAEVEVPQEGLLASYAPVWAHPYFRALIPMGFFNYGGLIAMQTLWAGPWMIKVAGYTPLEAATGLFGINVGMLITYWLWGMVTPALAARGWGANRLMTWGLPLSLGVLAYIILAGPGAGALAWAVYCVASTFVALAQPAVGMAFPAALAGRALSAYNLVLFLGIFVVQWGFGLLVDAFKGQGLDEVLAYQSALAVFALCCVAAYVRFLKRQSDG